MNTEIILLREPSQITGMEVGGAAFTFTRCSECTYRLSGRDKDGNYGFSGVSGIFRPRNETIGISSRITNSSHRREAAVHEFSHFLGFSHRKNATRSHLSYYNGNKKPVGKYEMSKIIRTYREDYE